MEKTTVGELAKRFRIDSTTLNRNMKPLADSGLIVINLGKDSRTREITLTKAGKDAVVWGGSYGARLKKR